MHHGPTVAFVSFQIHTLQQAGSVSRSECMDALKNKRYLQSISHAESFSSPLHFIVLIEFAHVNRAIFSPAWNEFHL